MPDVMLYQFDLLTGEFLHARKAQIRPNGEPMLEALAATPVAPPADVPEGRAARWTGKVWEVVEDHRQKLDEKGSKQGGTPYWLPEDDWRSPERFMENLGPLPEEASTERPQKPAPTTEELSTAVRTERDRRISATDYLMAQDYPLTDDERALWTIYRQALRDVPEQPGFPWSGPDDPACPWPAKPETKKAV